VRPRPGSGSGGLDGHLRERAQARSGGVPAPPARGVLAATEGGERGAAGDLPETGVLCASARPPWDLRARHVAD
jgi:hypothetical protein